MRLFEILRTIRKNFTSRNTYCKHFVFPLLTSWNDLPEYDLAKFKHAGKKYNVHNMTYKIQ
jgi:hypothetical protein